MSRRSTARAAAQRPTPPIDRSLIWIVTGIVGVILLTVVSYLVYQSQIPPPPPPAKATAADLNAPPALIKAANALHFAPHSEPGVGIVENEPASASPAPYSSHLLPKGTPAPVFTLKTPQGQSVTFPERGKATLLEFFATWCPHCQAEAPHLRRLAMLDAHRYDFVSVNADSEDAPSVFAFHRYFGLPYPALVDRSGSLLGSFGSPGSAGKVAQAYGMEAFPTFYVIDRQGRVWWAGDSEQPDAKLQQELAAAAAHG
jgi:peroxiredoxin